jgi:cytochrome c556
MAGGFMNRRISGLVLLTVFSLYASGAYAAYDQSTVKAVMKKNVSTMGALKKAVDSSDFQSAETAFRTFADNMKDLTAMTPPKGSKDDWDAVINEFIGTALKGAEASAQKDTAKVKQALDGLQALMKKGHSEFK